MSRQQRRKEEREARRRGASRYDRASGLPTGPRPWYYRYGYQVGIWGGAGLGVLLFFAFGGSFIGLIIGVVLGQVVGIWLSRRGRR